MAPETKTDEEEIPTGDTVVSAKSKLAVQLVDDPAAPEIVADGDTVITDPESEDAVSLVDKPGEVAPSTAGELRAAGYVVPSTTNADGKAVEVPDDVVPTAYAVDRVVSADDPLAVQEVVVPEQTFVTKLTPNQVAASLPAEPDDGEKLPELGADGKSPKTDEDDDTEAKAKATSPSNKAVSSSPKNK